MKIEICPKSSKSYATEENLLKAIEKLGFSNFPHLVCKNTENRWTAVFFGRCSNPVIFQGFKWVYGFDSRD